MTVGRAGQKLTRLNLTLKEQEWLRIENTKMERNRHTVRFKYLRHVFKSKGEVLRMLRGIRVNGDLKGLPYNGVHHCGRTHLPWGNPWGKLLKKKKKKTLHKKLQLWGCHGFRKKGAKKIPFQTAGWKVREKIHRPPWTAASWTDQSVCWCASLW